MTRQRIFNIRIRSAFVRFLGLLTVLMVLAATATAQNPVPFVDQPLVPDATAPGGPEFTLRVNGAGFVPASVVNWNGSPRATTFVSSSKLTATILASDITTASTASVTVVNPNPGGVSNIQYFSISTAKAPLSFLPAVAYNTGGRYTVADVNGDGKLDLLGGNSRREIGVWVNDVEVLLGNGDGTFQPARITDVGLNSVESVLETISVADLNGDGKPDLIVTTQSGELVVLLGNGDGTFQAPTAYDSGGGGAGAVAVADVNGDGKLDVVVTHYCGLSPQCTETGVGVLLGNGDGTLQAAQLYSSGGWLPVSVLVADVNGDGRPDLVVGNVLQYGPAGQGGVAVLLGNGDGTFQAARTYWSGGYSANHVAVGDVNGDGIPDLVASNWCIDQNCDQGAVGVLLGNGDGTFQAAQTYRSGGFGAAGAVVGDVNGDGKLDVVVADYCSSGTNVSPYCSQAVASGVVGVLLGNGDGTFQAAQTYASGGWGATGVALGDVNGDGKLDLLISNDDGIPILPAEGTGVIGVLLGNSGKPTTTTTLASSADPSVPKQTVTYTAKVQSPSGEPITGTVTFEYNWNPVAAVSLVANQATYSTSYSETGLHGITAVYSGDVNNAVSGSGVLVESITATGAKTPSTTTLASSGSPSLPGQPVTFTAMVRWNYGMVPDGELVTFYDGTTVMGTVPLAGGQAAYTTSSLSGATKNYITAKYAGDANFPPSSGTVTQVVKRYPTTTTFISSPNPSTYGEIVTWTATVTSTGPDVPTGNVRFVGAFGPGTLSAGTAIYRTAWLQAVTQTVTAEYQGDAANAPSSSAAANQVVNPAPTTTTITSSANPSSSGETVTFTAKVKSSTGASPVGTVTFTAGATVLGTVKIGNSPTNISTSTLPVGTTAIEATYNGTGDFVGSSDTLMQTVNQ